MRNQAIGAVSRWLSARIPSVSGNGFSAARQFFALRYFFYAFFFNPVSIRENCF